MLDFDKPVPRLKAGLVVGERYRIEGSLGEGDSAGNTYLAQDLAAGASCAIKVLAATGLQDKDCPVRAAFETVRWLDALSLPRLRALWSEDVDGAPCTLVAQDRVDALSLERRVAGSGPLTVTQVADLATKLLQILELLFTVNVIHGDIHPGNVLVSEDLSSVYLVDFGSLKAAARDIGMEDLGGPSGWSNSVTRAWAAPEARLGKPDHQSDLYGAGGVLFHALTGKKPSDVRRSLSGGVEPALLELEVPGAMAWFVGRLLHFTSGDRFPSPEEALQAWHRREIEDEVGEQESRDPEDLTNLHLEPLPALRHRWTRIGFGLSLLTALPLLAGVALAVFSALANPGGMNLYSRLVLAAASAALAAWHMVIHLPELMQLGSRSLAVTARELRYAVGSNQVEVPWRNIYSMADFGPFLMVRGEWRTRKKSKPRSRVLLLAPVYDLPLGELARFMEMQAWKARAEITDVRRLAENPPPAQSVPTFAGFGLVGLVLLLALLMERLVMGWDIHHLADPGTAPPPGTVPSMAQLVAGVAVGGDDAAAAVAAGQVDVAEVVAALADPDAALPPSLAALAMQRPEAWQDLAPEDVAALNTSVKAALQEFSAVMTARVPPGTVVESSDCPPGFTPRELVAAEVMAPACFDSFGTLVTVPGVEGLPPFLVDWTEVTLGDYQRCVAAEGCTAADAGDGCNTAFAEREQHPVNCVDRSQAAAYCQWAGRRLCYAEEWERAAGLDRHYPWGGEPADCTRAIMFGRAADGPVAAGCGRDSTAPVGSLPAGASACGALDMAGNVAEWVIDQRGAVRGGSYQNSASQDLTTAAVELVLPGERDPAVGFRCCLER